MPVFPFSTAARDIGELSSSSRVARAQEIYIDISRYAATLCGVRKTGDPDVGEVMKALSNETRLRILEWLKDPKANFDRQDIGDMDEDGVCVSLIQKKIGLSQSTTSHF